MEGLYIVLIATAFLALLCVFLYLQNNIIDVTNYSLNSNKVNKNYRIVHLSDMHSKPSKNVLKKVGELNPDIICITGDYINDHCKNKDKMLLLGKELVSIAPVFYITGNHERRLENFDGIMSELKDIGFNVLLNELSSHNEIFLLGLDENQADFDDYKARKNGTFEYKDMSPYFKRLDECDGFKIVLSHFPENFMGIKEMNYSKYDFDVQLSGHAHGGQFILPFFGPVFSPGQGIKPKYARGSYGKRPMLIVSRGLGNAEFPFRLFNHPEIIALDIKNSR